MYTYICIYVVELLHLDHPTLCIPEYPPRIVTAFVAAIITLPRMCYLCFLNTVLCLVSLIEDWYQEEVILLDFVHTASE